MNTFGRRVGVEFFGDATSLERSFAQVGAATKEFADLSVSTQTKVTQTTIDGTAKRIQSIRASVVEFQIASDSYVKGSDQQIAAAYQLGLAQKRLAALTGETAAVSAETAVATAAAGGAAAKTAERDFGKLSRGLIAGSGAASSLGRSLAFASTGFIAIAAGATILKSSISSALTLAATQKQVEAQLKTSGKTWEQYGAQVDKTDLRLSHISGFTNQDLLQSFGYLVRVTGNVSTALKLNATAADVARGRHIALSSASLALAKALGGSDTALRRLGIIIPKDLKGMDALNYVAAKFAGQAKAGATVADRFHAALVNVEEVIGTALLPTFEHLTRSLTAWFQKMTETGRLQRDVNAAVSDAGAVFHTLESIIRGIDKVTGSFGNTLNLVIGFVAVKKVAALGVALEGLAAKWGLVATAATAAGTAETAALGGGAAGGAAGAASGSTIVTRVAQYTGAGAGAAAAARAPGLLTLGRLGGLAVAAFAAADAGAEVQKGQSKVVNGWKFYSLDGKNWVRGEYVGFPTTFTPQFLKFGQRFGPASAFTPSGFGLGSKAGIAPARPFGGLQPIPVFKTYSQTIGEGLAQARAALTTTMKDDVAAAKNVIARIKRGIDRGHYAGASLIQALQAEATAEGTISSARQQAAARAAQIAAAKKAAASSYTTPIDIQLAQARAELTASTADDTRAAKQAIAAARAAIASGAKNKQGLIAAIQAIVAAKQGLQQLATTYTLPAKLELALARAQALGLDQTKILLKMKAALEKALKAAKGNIQKQTDIYNQIAGINQQLGASVTAALGGFKQASTASLTKGLGLTAAQRKALKARLSQLGPGGTVPGDGVGAGGYRIDPDTGRPVVVHSYVHIDGKKVAESTTKHQQRHRRRNPHQRRGPHAGTA